MIDRPILFSKPTVRAIIDDRKTQTRRVMKPQPILLDDSFGPAPQVGESNGKAAVQCNSLCKVITCPYGQPGDRLWVRENGWERPERTPKMMREGADTWEPYYFDADGYTDLEREQFKEWGFKRRPSIHMPRWASRILLEIVNVRVERLQDISVADCCAEGAPLDKTHAVETWYHELWEFINGPGSWDANPWVWVVEFKVVKP